MKKITSKANISHEETKLWDKKTQIHRGNQIHCIFVQWYRAQNSTYSIKNGKWQSYKQCSSAPPPERFNYRIKENLDEEVSTS